MPAMAFPYTNSIGLEHNINHAESKDRSRSNWSIWNCKKLRKMSFSETTAEDRLHLYLKPAEMIEHDIAFVRITSIVFFYYVVFRCSGLAEDKRSTTSLMMYNYGSGGSSDRQHR
eukprot:gb/GEZJ01005837.1/.p1 GENE.gb/GEZJ01005837.1/~~gb/GEZJ01005837.1/.p1  ORF type:complete len:115 (-),score=8.98 gb/GEZJ01005837.1/:841-1185(-)